MAQMAEKEAREEAERVKLEIQTERAHVRAARDIEKHKQEQSLETKWNEFRLGTEDVNKQLDTLLEAFGQLSNVNVTVAGKSFGKTNFHRYSKCCMITGVIIHLLRTALQEHCYNCINSDQYRIQTK